MPGKPEISSSGGYGSSGTSAIKPGTDINWRRQQNCSQQRGRELYRLREDLKTKGEMIRKGEEIIRILTRATPDGIFSSIDGTIVKVNEQFAEMLGYSPAELAGRSLLDVVSPDSSAGIMTAFRSGSGGTFEFDALHQNGSSFRAEATAYPVRYREDTVMVSIVRRVSDTAISPGDCSGSW